MVIARENNEIVIRIPDADSTFEISELQRLVEYINFRRIVKKSTATQDQIDELARDVNSSWRNANKARLLGE